MARYSQGFKNAILLRVLPPNNQSVATVARDTGVTEQTLRNWLAQYKDGTLPVDTDKALPTPGQRSVREKFRLLMEGKQLNEEQLGDWLRTHGLHSEHLPLWEQELEGVVMDKQEDLKRKNKEQAQEIRRLKREAERNEKAMAEALALLTLKKKADKLFDLDEGD